MTSGVAAKTDGTERFDLGVSLGWAPRSPATGRLNGISSLGPLKHGFDTKASLNYLYGLSYIFEVRVGGGHAMMISMKRINLIGSALKVQALLGLSTRALSPRGITVAPCWL